MQDDLPERMMVNNALLVRAFIESQQQALSIDDRPVTHRTILESVGIALTFALSLACVGATTWLAINGVWQAAIPIGILPATAGHTGLTIALRRLFRSGSSFQSDETDLE